MNVEQAYIAVVDRLEREHESSYEVGDFQLSEWSGNGWFVRFTCRPKRHTEFPIDCLAFFAEQDGGLEMTRQGILGTLSA